MNQVRLRWGLLWFPHAEAFQAQLEQVSSEASRASRVGGGLGATVGLGTASHCNIDGPSVQP